MFISDKSIGSFNINDVTGMSHQFAIWHHKAKKKRMFPVVLGIGRENHYRLSEHISRLIIDCTIEMYVPLTLTSEVIKMLSI